MLQYLAKSGGIALLEVEPGLLIWTLVVFGLVMFVLRTFAWKPIANALDERAEKISRDIDRADGIRKEAELRLNEYNEKLNGLREEGLEIIAEARRDAESLRDEILKTAKDDAGAIKERGARDIHLAMDKALEDYHERVSTLSMAVAARILDKNLDADAHKEIIERSIRSLEHLN